MYEDSSFGGCELVKNGSDASFVNDDPCNFGADGFNDDTSSADNNESHTVTLCGDIDYKGGITDVMPANTEIAQVSPNDTASSLFYGSTNC